MPIFLGFLKNTVTGEEFVAPVTADSRGRAEVALLEQYPPVAYHLYTTYERKELDRILSSIDRWPGVASSVQPSLDVLLARVNVGRRSLPPLPSQRPVAPQASADGARVEQVRSAAHGVSPQAQALAARLLAAGMGKPLNPQASAPLHSDARPTAAPVQTAEPTPKMPAWLTQMRAPEATQPSVAAPAAAPARPSLIEMLKAMKG